MISKYSTFYHLICFCLQLDSKLLWLSVIWIIKNKATMIITHNRKSAAWMNYTHPWKCGLQCAGSTWTAAIASKSSSPWPQTLSSRIPDWEFPSQVPSSSMESEAYQRRHTGHSAAGNAGAPTAAGLAGLVPFLRKTVSYNGRWRRLNISSLHTQP